MLIYNLLHFPGDMILFNAAMDINCEKLYDYNGQWFVLYFITNVKLK